MQKIIKHPIFWFILFLLVIFRETIFKRFVLLPADTLAGSYFPWLDYKWGFPTGVPVKNPPISDVFSQFFIWKLQSINLWKQAIPPLWNRLSFAGTPLLASIHWAVLFPANLLLLLPKYTGWNLYLIFSTFTAFSTMYLFLGRLTKHKAARFVGSLIFSFAGPMTTWFEFGTGVWAASLLPLCFYLLDIFISSKKHIYLTLLSLSLALLIFAGHVQLTTYTFALLPLYVLFQTNFKLSGDYFWIALSLLLGISLTSVQLLPTFDFYKASIRSLEKYSADFNFGLSPFSELIRLWAADFFGHPSTYNHWSSVSYHEYSSFLGTLSLPLIGSFLFSNKKNKYTFFFYVFFLSLFFAVSNPVSKLVFGLPIPLLTYSSASRLFFLTSFSGGILVAGSLENFKETLLKRKILCVNLILIVLTLIAVKLAPQTYQRIAIRNTLIPLGILSTFSLVLILLRKRTNFIILFVCLVFLFDFGRYFRKYNPQVPNRLTFPTTDVISYLQNQSGVFRIAITKDNLLPPNTWSYYGLEAIEGYDPLRLLNYNRLFNVVNKNSFYSKPSRYSELERFNPNFLDALNVKYFVTLKPGISGQADQDLKTLKLHEYKQVYSYGTVSVYESPTVRPRAFFVDSYKVASSDAQLDELLSDQSFDPRSVAVLTVNPKIPLNKPSNARAEIVSYQDNQLTFNLNTDTSALLVISNTYTSDWHAHLDNQEVPLYQVDGALQAILVPSGKHLLKLTYSPYSFKRGLLISALSLLALLVTECYIVIKFKKRKNT